MTGIRLLCAALALPLAAAAAAEGLPDDVLERFDASMVRVAGGPFTMGCTPEQGVCESDEHPARRVAVASFEIGRHEVTQALWHAVMGTRPAAFGDCPQCPVETVSWDDAREFLVRLEAVGGDYRLPSEAEWEFAARGGVRAEGRRYAGSDRWGEVAWYYENSGNRTHPVGGKLPNELGLFDMSGNVREWVQDCRQDSYEGAPATGAAWESGNCGRRSIRGGSWYGKPSYVRTANRFWYTTYFRNNNLGFRLARSVE